MKNCVFLLTLATSLCACNMTRNLDEMHDDTQKMSKRTEDLTETSDKLKILTNEMYKDLRQGNADMARSKDLKALKEARSMAEKYDLAGKYLASFEFQLWSSILEDTPKHREELMHDATREFMLTIQEFAYAGQTQPEPMAIRSDVDGGLSILATIDDSNNRQQCLNAIAAALHFLNPKQERLAALKPEVKTVSMYDLFEQSFEILAKNKRGEIADDQIPGFAYEILKFPKVAVLLMNVRYNILGFVSAYQLSDINQESYVKPILDGNMVLRWRYPVIRWNVLKHSTWASRNPGWPLNYGTLTPPERQEISMLLKWGSDTRDMLTKNGVTPFLVPAVKKIMTHIQLTDRQNGLIAGTPVRLDGLPLNAADEQEGALIRSLMNY